MSGDVRESLAARISMLEAWEAAFEQRHAVVDIVVDAEDPLRARQALMDALNVGAAQAGAILDTRLARWSAAERQTCHEDLCALRERLAESDSP
jgi:DNA gyrase/topoisomerase IV subunit A